MNLNGNHYATRDVAHTYWREQRTPWDSTNRLSNYKGGDYHEEMKKDPKTGLWERVLVPNK